MKAFYSDIFELPLPSTHRFPMVKYRRLRDHILDLSARYNIEMMIALPATDKDLESVHSGAYLRRVMCGDLTALEVRRIGFPWSPQLVERSRRSVGATISAARAALVDGVGVNLAGGTHHAFVDRGQGYCVFNDVAVAIRVLQSEGLIQRAVVIDCDVHQGNGTAAIFKDDESVFTFSVHGKQNFPFSKIPGDLDIALPDGTTDEEYLGRLYDAIERMLPLSDVDCGFYLAGVDPYEHDRLGRLKLTTSGLEQRDELVLSSCQQHGLPMVIMMAGGYAEDVEQTVSLHAATIRIACLLYAPRKTK